MDWWLEHKFRMIQNNLRDIDGKMNVDLEVAALKKLHANVVQVGCGGITAFSETALPTQKRSACLEGDKFGELLTKCHENGIRVIARFDASKVDASFEETHPEWMLRDASGRTIHYNDTVVTCLNSAYQQEEIPKILTEVLEKYPVDGVFFNMFGYQDKDYDGNYFGPCHCENCKKRFRKMFKDDLPAAGEKSGPRWRNYQKFKRETVDEILGKIRATVKEVRPAAALSTYFDEHVDIIRCETNTAVNRPLPFWIYSASDNVSCIENTFRDKASSNVGINAVDIPYRFTGVSDTFNRTRLYQNIGSRGNLDWCIIGTFDGYPDRSNFRGVEEVFGFHERYQSLYDAAASAAHILLLSPGKPYGGNANREYRGIFRMLKEAHVVFDTLIDTDSEAYAVDPAGFDLVIVPGIPKLRSAKLREIFLSGEQKFLGTAGSFARDPEMLEKCFGIAELNEQKPVRGGYFLTEPKDVFKSFRRQDWVYADRKRWEAVLAEEETEDVPADNLEDASDETSGLKAIEDTLDEAFGKDSAKEAKPVILPYITPAPYGPPERCYGHEVTDIPGVILGEKSAAMLFEPGALYDQQGYEFFKFLLLDLVDRLLPKDRQAPFTTDAHPKTEIFLNKLGERTAMLELLNLTGFEGVTILPPVTQKGVTVKFGPEIDRVVELGAEKQLPVTIKDNGFEIPELGLHKAYLVRFKDTL